MRKLAVFFMFAFMVSTPLAKTKDGITPANETVCDSLRGQTRGLFGLCVAYCEARDLDRDATPGELQKLAARQAKFLEKYNAKKGPADPDMPCVEKNVCPCWANSAVGASNWLNKSVPVACSTFDGQNLQFNNLQTTVAFDHAEYTSMAVTSYAPDGTNYNYFCSHFDNATNTKMVHQFNATDAQVCRTQITGTCSVLGF